MGKGSRDPGKAGADPHSLGNLLKDCGKATDQDLERALRYQQENPDIMLGEALCRIGLLARDTLDALLAQQRALRRGRHQDVLDLAKTATQRVQSLADSSGGVHQLVLQAKEKLGG